MTLTGKRRQTVAVGVAGCGRIAQLVHLPALARLPGAHVVAVADADAARRETAARRFPGAVSLVDWTELAEHPLVEAVVVALPSHLHAPAALAALANGKHVYVEKPLATSLADGVAVVEAWRRTGVVGAIGFNYRFNDGVTAARQSVEGGALGPLVAARSSFTSLATELPEWKRRRETGGGVLLDLGSHHVDLARFVLGREVEEVFARVSSQLAEDDTAAVELRLEGGLPVQCLVSHAAPDADTFEVVGRRGRLLVDRSRTVHPLDRLLARSRERSFERSLARFVAAVAAGSGETSPDLADGLRSLAVVLAAEESACSGRAVPVPEAAP